ncbi:RNA polymerase sigma factor (sigma-70 family) [Prauserella isguenensis]|uniref:RNA polymerase sigma factor (Sigma-70 family) n=1 Tax=Prauserella isguenensis TaxID=1470180 RepID=A0A839RYU8_9PSEU|nr:RNA polymerase sigma factor (sigma-70 family) [Prauserella isguenensis]
MAGAARHGLSDATAAVAARRRIEALWRIESARIVAGLARYTGELALAEDVAQEALAEALVNWPREGVPRDPVAWLLTTGRRRAIDAFRRRSALDDRLPQLDTGPAPERPDDTDDDVLTLMFTACHPVLSREAQVALTLRVVGGLTSDEIARAFLVSTATVQARITRAKKSLGAAAAGFRAPQADELGTRLAAVLSVVYVIFTEGSSASSGDALIRFDLAGEARRLARVLARLMPGENEVHGLLALLELTSARFPARTDADGEPVLLEDQDRRLWDDSSIRRGRATLRSAEGVGRGLGYYGLQAAIAERHAVARSVADTDWERIVALYEALATLAPSPVVELNRAVAVSMAHGPAEALPLVDAVADDLCDSHQVAGVRGELLLRLGRTTEARTELRRAVSLCGNDRERTILHRKLADLP